MKFQILFTALTLTGPGLLEAFEFGGTVSQPNDVWVHEFSSSPLSQAAAPPGAPNFSCLVMYCFPFPQRFSLS